YLFFFSSRRRHTSFSRDWSSDVCSSDLIRKLASAVSAFASATRDFSPPERTLIFLNTSSPVNRKLPRIDRNSVSVCLGAKDCNRSEERRVGKESTMMSSLSTEKK